jgi:hypothetical protein
MRFIISVILLYSAIGMMAQGNDILLLSGQGQGSDIDEPNFFAETKQVNQFFRRFNGEENIKGVKLLPTDSLWHETNHRQKFINALFDENNQQITASLKKAFIHDVISSNSQDFLDFHGENWFGESEVKFDRGGTEVPVTLFMKLVSENLGSKWIIADVAYNPYENLYKPDAESPSRFLHPLSHELDFMNLDKVFQSNTHTGDYFYQGFSPDKLSIFLYELNNNRLKFKYVSSVKFHFFQIEGWYFEITEFNRPGMNRGWLISTLIKLEEGNKESLESFILHRD